MKSKIAEIVGKKQEETTFFLLIIIYFKLKKLQ